MSADRHGSKASAAHMRSLGVISIDAQAATGSTPHGLDSIGADNLAQRRRLAAGTSEAFLRRTAVTGCGLWRFSTIGSRDTH